MRITTRQSQNDGERPWRRREGRISIIIYKDEKGGNKKTYLLYVAGVVAVPAGAAVTTIVIVIVIVQTLIVVVHRGLFGGTFTIFSETTARSSTSISSDQRSSTNLAVASSTRSWCCWTRRDRVWWRGNMKKERTSRTSTRLRLTRCD